MLAVPQKVQVVCERVQATRAGETPRLILCILPELCQDGRLAANELVAQREKVIYHKRLVYVSDPIDIYTLLVIPQRKPRADGINGNHEDDSHNPLLLFWLVVVA